MAADVTVIDHGSVVQFGPFSDRGREWVDENVETEGWQWLGNTFSVDHRYAPQLLHGFEGAGLSVDLL